MNQVARVFQRPVGADPDASQLTAAAMCPAGPLNQSQLYSNQQAAELVTCQSENLSGVSSPESVLMRTTGENGGGAHCYREWPPSLVNAAVSLESLDLNGPYLDQDRASCSVVHKLNQPVNIFDKRHVHQTPHDHDQEPQDAAHAPAFDGLAGRLDPYRTRSLPVEALKSLHENGFNNNSRRQQQQQDCLPLNYEWPSAVRLRSQQDSLTSSWRPRIDQFSAELGGLCHLPQLHREPTSNFNIATSDLLDQARRLGSQTFNQRPFDNSSGGTGPTLSTPLDARLNCACLECCRRHFELSAQIGSDRLERDDKNEFCRQLSPIGPPLAPPVPTRALLVIEPLETDNHQNHWRSRSVMSIPNDLTNGFDTTTLRQHQPMRHQANSGHFYGAEPELNVFELDPTSQHNITISSPLVMSHQLGHQHHLGQPLHNLPAVSIQHQRLATVVQPQRPSLLQQPSNSMAQFQFRPQNQQPEPWSLPASPVVGQAGARYYNRRLVQPPQVQQSHLSRWPAQKLRQPPPNGHNNDHKLVQNFPIGPEEYLTGTGGGGCKSTADELNCQIKLPFDGDQPADWEDASWHANPNPRSTSVGDEADEFGEEEEEEEEAETLALVPSQAKGRLPMSVAEQMSEQASKFVQTHPNSEPSPGPRSSRRPVVRSPTSGHWRSSTESFALGKQQLADQRRHRQQRQQSTPSTRSRSLAGNAPSERSHWTGGEQQNATNSLQVRRTLRVKVRKSKPILGIAIEGGFNVSGQLIPRIVCVHEKGAAYQCGKLHASDLILEVNGVSTVNMTHDEIAETIANAYYQDERPYIEFLIGESVRV